MKNLKFYAEIPAPPEEVYAALTNDATLQLITGTTAIMKPEPNTEFNLWDGGIVGKNISFKPGVEIVQEWYFEDEEEKEPSIVTLRFHPHKKGTSLEVKHTNIPDEIYENMEDGWHNVYIAALIDFYA